MSIYMFLLPMFEKNVQHKTRGVVQNSSKEDVNIVCRTHHKSIPKTSVIFTVDRNILADVILLKMHYEM